MAQPAMCFEELREAVGKASGEKLTLEMDAHGESCKGRYLVATCAMKAGEVIFTEVPLFEGSTDAKNSQKVYTETFLQKLQNEEFDLDDDAFHPCSPLIDCVAAVLLSKLSGDQVTLRKFGALSPSTEDVTECVEDLWHVLRPEFKHITSPDELSYILLQILNNRFAHGQHMHLLFAGSMFEHSCSPNCFLGRAQYPSDPSQTFRALREIVEGEALSIDYLTFPSGYLPASSRSEFLKKWGFVCTCPRCVELPEVERSFTCAGCGEPELCPRRPGSLELQCLSCKQIAEVSYAKRCFEQEDLVETGEIVENLLSHRHHIVVQALMEEVLQGLPEPKERPAFQEVLESLVDSLQASLRVEHHPAMLEIYHLAALTRPDVEGQKHYLELENDILQRFYSEEAEKQLKEAMSLMMWPTPPTKDGRVNP